MPRGYLSRNYVFVVFTLIWTTILLETSKCSIVLDGMEKYTGEKAIYMKEYCPKMEFCPEGSHVMCMYYNPRNVMGPKCHNARNISMTPEIAKTLLNVMNAIRGKVALGIEKGLNGEILPRGYSMFRLQWDSELATFAQVLTNQCVLRHDLCRASKKFPNPSQLAGLVRFTYPDWIKVEHGANFADKGLTATKIHWAVTEFLRNWYLQKQFVSEDMILTTPDWSLTPKNTNGRMYLDMIAGSATHIGCGISAYTEYIFRDPNTRRNHNSIQIICNYSSAPRKGKPVYITKQPTDVGHTVRCGCPVGYDEDANCLCYESSPKPPKTCDKNGKNCKPTVVLLPIFTVEDAPQHTLIGRQGPPNPTIEIPGLEQNVYAPHARNSLDDLFSDYEDHGNNIDSMTTFTYRPTLPYIESRPFPDPLNRIYETHRKPRVTALTERSQLPDVRNRYYAKSPLYQHTQSRRIGHVLPRRKNTQSTRKSIFSRVQKFELPGLIPEANNNPQSIKMNINIIRKDVAPRRDFTNARKLIDTYLNKKRKISNSLRVNEYDNIKEMIGIPKYKEAGKETGGCKGTDNYKENGYNGLNTDPLYNVLNEELKQMSLNTTRNKATNFNRFLTNKFHYQGFNVSDEPIKRFDIKSSNEEADKKLMTLLDNLEQEVKHVQLNGNKKEIFDAKIRKIYGSVVGKSADILIPEPRLIIHMNPDEAESKKNKYEYEPDFINHYTLDNVEDPMKKAIDKKMYETEDKIKEIHSTLTDQSSIQKHTLRRSQNSLMNEEEKNYKNEVMKKRNYMSLANKNVYNDELGHRAVHKNNEYTNKYNNIDHHRRDNYFNDEDTKERNHFRHINNELKYRKNKAVPIINNYKDYRNKETADFDSIGIERRKFYQEKLDNIERKLRMTQRHHSDHDKERQRRLMRPTGVHNDLQIRPNKPDSQDYYLPARARFLHGF